MLKKTMTLLFLSLTLAALGGCGSDQADDSGMAEDSITGGWPTHRHLCSRYRGYPGDHISSMETMGGLQGCRFEYTIGYSLSSNGAGFYPVRGDKYLYSCIVYTPRGREYFTTTDPNCEGQSTSGSFLAGAVWNTGGSGRHPVYRCRTWEGEHFDSIWQNCEGFQLEHMHGYMY
ncbi:MAG: hypothetical protein H6729_05170 [Deltaproteobacteria bacterium]|nr:hypothetical protein [Deltaproteobacteria bacterium]